LSAGKIKSMSRLCHKVTPQWFCKTIYCETAPAVARNDLAYYCSEPGIVDLNCPMVDDHPDREYSASDNFESQITPWQSVDDPFWLYPQCDVNPQYQQSLLEFWANLKYDLSIDGIAEECGLWRRYKKSKKEWMHFECEDQAECQP
jgi:hypothetical protein